MHFFDLFSALKNDCEFYLCHNTNKIWYLNTRPLPKNAHFVPYYEKGKYDFAILDVDQQLVNKDIGKRKIYVDLNNLIQDIPKVVINHGTPVYPEYCKLGDMSYKDAEKIVIAEIKKLVGDNPMIVNSYESATEREWGWGYPILHGMNPKDWVDLPKEPRIFTALSPGGCDHYYNREAMNDVSYILNDKYGYNLWWAKVNVDTGHKVEDYKNFLGASLIYLDTSFRTPMNRARTEAMMCLKPNSRVIMANDFSYKDIKDVKENDKVIDKNGEKKTVLKVYSKNTNEDFYHIKASGHEPIECSGKHKFLAIKTKQCHTGNGMICRPNCIQRCSKKYYKDYKLQWIEAQNLKRDDFLVSPVSFLKNDKDDIIKISDYVSGDKIVKRDGYIRWKGCHNNLVEVCRKQGRSYGWIKECLRKNRWPGKKSMQFLSYLKDGGYADIGFFKDEIKITSKLSRFIGYYIAEGYTQRSTVKLCFHQKESEYHKDVVRLVKDLFGIDAKIVFRINNRAEVVFNNMLIAEFLENSCGKGCKNKRISLELMNSDRENLIHLLAGLYRGDGYLGNDETNYTTVSSILAYQVYFVLKKLMIHGSIKRRKQRERMSCDSYVIRSYGGHRDKIKGIAERFVLDDSLECKYNSYWKNDKLWFYPIKEITKERYNGKIYDLAVDGHNYLVNGLVTHNSGCCVVQVKGAHDLDKFIKEGENMILVDNEPREIAALLVDLIENHYKDCIEIGQKGKETAKKMFNYKRYREDWMNFIHDILKI